MTWIAVIGTLLGTLIGAAATLVAQQIAARAADKREQIQRRAVLRAEVKTHIDSFLDAAQAVERIAGDANQFDYAEKTLAHQNFWTQHKRLALVCSTDLSEPLDRLANVLSTTLWHGTPDGVPVWKHVADSTWQFREAARREIKWREE